MIGCMEILMPFVDEGADGGDSAANLSGQESRRPHESEGTRSEVMRKKSRPAGRVNCQYAARQSRFWRRFRPGVREIGTQAEVGGVQPMER